MNLAGSGTNTVVEDNQFGGGAGQIGNEVGYDETSLENINGVMAHPYPNPNDPEVMLEEANGVLFEGRLGSVSPDGRLIWLPDVRSDLHPLSDGPGQVVSILAGVNSDGSPNMNDAGQWFPVRSKLASIRPTTASNCSCLNPSHSPQAGDISS